MIQSTRLVFGRAARSCCLLVGIAGLIAGCAEAPHKAPPPIWVGRPEKKVPDFMRGTIFEKVDLENTDPYPVSSYGLVVNLANTGDSTAPTAVLEYMRKEMEKRGMGSKVVPNAEYLTPDRVLHDKRVAIVQVTGLLPPGVRQGQMFDVYVSCLPNNRTTSLAGGKLWDTELKKDGANPQNPFGAVNVYGRADGFVFVNPAYALNRDPNARGSIKASLRNGVILDGGVAVFDRPLFLRLRKPQNSVARAIEQRLIDRFQDTHIAQAENEAIVQLYVPMHYNGDWEHFSQLAMHVYMENSPEFAAARARKLVTAAMQPGAPLEDISYCWEGLGTASLPVLAPVISDEKTPPDVAFAAARAAAFIGDPTGAAAAALLQMARNDQHPFQLNAVQALGSLPSSAAVNHMLRQLLDSEKSLVRIEAYKILARNHDGSIYSQLVTPQENNQKFVLDIVPSHGQPLIYASSSGIPRIAIIGTMPDVATPVMFSALDNRLTISSTPEGRGISIFYRQPAPVDSENQPHDIATPAPVQMMSHPELSEVIARLGGVTAGEEAPLNFTYSEVLAIIQKLSDSHKLIAYQDGRPENAAFVMQEPPRVQESIYAAPSIDAGRPNGAEPTGKADPLSPDAIAKDKN